MLFSQGKQPICIDEMLQLRTASPRLLCMRDEDSFVLGSKGDLGACVYFVECTCSFVGEKQAKNDKHYFGGPQTHLFDFS